MNFIIREMRAEEYPQLEEFLYQAIFVAEGQLPPPRSILQNAELRVYLDGFGSGYADFAIAAESDGKIVGAVWVRDMPDYGHVEDGVPSFAVSVLPEYRSCGAGTAMMKAMLELLARRGFDRASLAVQKANYALRLYKKLGFEIVDENDEEYIMVRKIKP